MRLAVIGGGWAGMAAAVRATQAGFKVTVLEASRTLGGRARKVASFSRPNQPLHPTLDNGQHILLGAYAECLNLMRLVGVDTEAAFLRAPLRLGPPALTEQSPQCRGFELPVSCAHLQAQMPSQGHRKGHGHHHAAQLAKVAWAIWRSTLWPVSERLQLLRVALHWHGAGFSCPKHLTVEQLCAQLGPKVISDLIEPLCVSALNTPIQRASARVFLRVMHDALFTTPGGSDVLIPRTDLSALFPEAACNWLEHKGAVVHLGQRVRTLKLVAPPCSAEFSQPQNPAWSVNGHPFDAVVVATPPWDAADLIEGLGDPDLNPWVHTTRQLRYEGIATVYLTARTPLAAPMVQLRSSKEAPAQFVFDKGALNPSQPTSSPTLLAAVVSAFEGNRQALEHMVLAQIQNHLAQNHLGSPDVQVLQTIVEKRATFSCTAGLVRPAAQPFSPALSAPALSTPPRSDAWRIAASTLVVCGDYIEGPYPATLEGAVRSAGVAVELLRMPPSKP
ncbi:MAG: FAD-binding protein [Betaproteobacteria bacterium]|nr:FAD-binding protein [Betaproteobacteria bacterium]